MPAAQAGPPPDAARQHLTGLLGPVVESSGYDLEDVTVTRAGRRSLVRVIVDADGGVDLDAVADVSRAISAALDDGDPFAGPYVLEVSSPGVDRPLREPRHWRRATGRLVAVDAGDTPIVGRILDSNDQGVTLEVDGARRHLPWSGLGAGRVQVEFNRRTEDGASAEHERG
jgi:ribosome maturation factor RimP